MLGTSGDILATPAGFARGILGLKQYDWQADVLNMALETPGMTSVRCCNEAGKTTNIAAPAVCYVMELYPGAQVVVTSGAWRQVRHQLFPAIQRFSSRLPGLTIHDTTVTSDKGSRCVGFSTDDAGLFEGFHVGPGGHRETPLLIIVDEAKSVQEAIFQAIDRCRPTWLLMLSSPGSCVGRFYASHTSQRSHYRTAKIPARLCPHIAQRTIDDIVARYGADHWFVQSSIHAEFSDNGASGLVITLQMVEDCIAQPVAKTTGERHCFCDFAAGRDENVCALRTGNDVRIVRAWTERNTMAACGEFIALWRKHDLKPGEISGDADGLGGPMCDRFAELGWPIARFHGGLPANDKLVYANRAAEVWGSGAAQIARRHVHLQGDPRLVEQLTARKWKRFSDGTALLQSKEEMRAEGLSSPDRADAVLGCLQPSPDPAASRERDPFAGTHEEEHHAIAGMHAG